MRIRVTHVHPGDEQERDERARAEHGGHDHGREHQLTAGKERHREQVEKEDALPESRSCLALCPNPSKDQLHHPPEKLARHSLVIDEPLQRQAVAERFQGHGDIRRVHG